MFVFGHLGWGATLARAMPRTLPIRPLLFGTLLPDLIDKPLFYFFGGAGDFLSGTRLFGHTLLLVAGLALAACAFPRARAVLAAVSFGSLTHLGLDVASDALRGAEFFSEVGILHAVLWPLLGPRFPGFPHADAAGHWASLLDPVLLFFEGTGAYLLWKLNQPSARSPS